MNRAIGILGAGLISVAVTSCGGGGAAPTSPTPAPTAATPTPTPTPTPSPAPSGSVRWEVTGSGTWQPTGTPPPCPSPLTFRPPVDLARVTSILYPGQSRPDYKPHGGFRFDLPGQTAEVQYVAPQAGYIFRGARYLTNGEIQYTFDIINECGVMHRVGHLRDLAPRFLQLASGFPAAAENDSRTTLVAAGEMVSAGEVIGTAVGLRNSANYFADWGVFDLRQRNARSADPSWLAAHPGELAAYAICWFDNLTAADSARVRSLPAGDPAAGKVSDFCQ